MIRRRELGFRACSPSCRPRALEPLDDEGRDAAVDVLRLGVGETMKIRLVAFVIRASGPQDVMVAVFYPLCHREGVRSHRLRDRVIADVVEACAGMYFFSIGEPPDAALLTSVFCTSSARRPTIDARHSSTPMIAEKNDAPRPVRFGRLDAHQAGQELFDDDGSIFAASSLSRRGGVSRLREPRARRRGPSAVLGIDGQGYRSKVLAVLYSSSKVFGSGFTVIFRLSYSLAALTDARVQPADTTV